MRWSGAYLDFSLFFFFFLIYVCGHLNISLRLACDIIQHIPGTALCIIIQRLCLAVFFISLLSFYIATGGAMMERGQGGGSVGNVSLGWSERSYSCLHWLEQGQGGSTILLITTTTRTGSYHILVLVTSPTAETLLTDHSPCRIRSYLSRSSLWR